MIWMPTWMPSLESSLIAIKDASNTGGTRTNPELQLRVCHQRCNYPVHELAPIVRRLNAAAREEEGPAPHGDERYGAYSMQALHGSLRAKGYQLRYLNSTSNCKSAKWFRKLPRSTLKHIVMVGRPSGQVEGTWHCIARAAVGDKYYFIDSDEIVYKPSSEDGLRHVFVQLGCVYAVEPINNKK
ncbi:unnamed protein product [Phytophthora fragariaefolia]|uniref:Unnamed protein product n=1 Tax=Phytophthora fragariaefolia TaxID=1490495 RepID=A0A9W6XWD0_9STRA|nr:unnamed protein product [Phytophthora fragariaefolia]